MTTETIAIRSCRSFQSYGWCFFWQCQGVSKTNITNSLSLPLLTNIWNFYLLTRYPRSSCEICPCNSWCWFIVTRRREGVRRRRRLSRPSAQLYRHSLLWNLLQSGFIGLLLPRGTRQRRWILGREVLPGQLPGEDDGERFQPCLEVGIEGIHCSRGRRFSAFLGLHGLLWSYGVVPAPDGILISILTC